MKKPLKDLTYILIIQHIKLGKSLAQVKNLAQLDPPNFKKIIKELKKFEKLLEKHLNLEDNIFYPELLKKLEEHDFDTEEMKEFIKKIDAITTLIKTFLAKYSHPKDLENNFEKFKEDLKNISTNLIMRIDAEENIIYSHWQLE